MFRKVVVKNQQANQSSRIGIRVLLIGLAMVTFSQTAGCKLGIKDQVMLTYRDEVWSRRAYNLRYGNCEREYSEHFQNGFCEGYRDMCNGGDGYVPALPPEDYRSPEYQSADGARCVNSWFEGYPAGVAAAKKDKSGTYHDVLISRMINSAVAQSKTKPVLPGDVKVVSGQSAERTNGTMQAPVVNPQSRYQYPPSNSNSPDYSQPTFDIPPQAYVEPAEYPQLVPAESLMEAEQVSADSSTENSKSDQPITEPGDDVDNLEQASTQTADVVPVNWDEESE